MIRALAYLVLMMSLVFACQRTETPPDSPLFYFPSTVQLQEGLVNKYYLHYQSDDGFDKSTDIRYYAYRLVTDNELQVITFNPGFEMIGKSNYEVRDGKMIAKDRFHFWRNTEYKAVLKDSVYLDWHNDKARFSSETAYEEETFEKIAWQQTQVKDTLLNQLPAKIFTREQKRRYEYLDSEDRIFQDTFTDIYVKGLGLFQSEWTTNKGKAQLELIKQFSWEDFHALSKAAPKRVAYIDPAERMDQDNDFRPCDGPAEIYDYYNSNPNAAYALGKRGWQKRFQEQLDPATFLQESGFLTFRFIINCEGKVGYFITEEADLDYQPKQFPKEIVAQVLQVIRSVEDWTPLHVRQKSVDAYAYLTLKFRDGQLIDILP